MVGLLDTSTLLRLLSKPERLSPAARKTIEREQIVLSIASFWEVAIKSRKGLLVIADPVSWWNRVTALFPGEILSIRTSRITALCGLPDFRKDPFDRILVAQATAEGFAIITNDRQIAAYPVRTLW